MGQKRQKRVRAHNLRLSERERVIVEELAEMDGVSMTDAIRLAIHRTYRERLRQAEGARGAA